MNVIFRAIGIVTAMILLAACASETAHKEEYGGFLTDYSRLKEQEASDGTMVLAWVNPKTSAADYNAIIIEPVILSPNSVISDQITPERLEEIFDSLEEKLNTALGKVATVTDKRGKGVLRYRLAISGVAATQRDPRWYEYTPITFTASQIGSATGMRDDVVELFVEGELTDSVTGVVISEAIRKGQSAAGVGQGEPITPDKVEGLLQQWADSAATYMSNLEK